MRILSKLVLAALICAAPLAACDRTTEHAKANASAKVGGAFQLVDQDGKAVTEKDLLGKPTAIFFGFTFCPEVCPTTLTEMTGWLKDLGPDADKLNVVFVSVDPERDTIEKLGEYAHGFHKDTLAATADIPSLEAFAKSLSLVFAKVPLGDDAPADQYTMDHSGQLVLLDPKGRMAGIIQPPFQPKAIAEDLIALTTAAKESR